MKVTVKKHTNTLKTNAGKEQPRRKSVDVFICLEISILLLVIIILIYCICMGRYENMPYCVSIFCSILSMMLGISFILFILEKSDNPPKNKKRKRK